MEAEAIGVEAEAVDKITASTSLPLNFDFGDLRLRDLAKLLFFNLIMTKSNLKKL